MQVPSTKHNMRASLLGLLHTILNTQPNRDYIHRAGSGAGALLATALDEVAWLLNLRGGDVPYNPVFVSYVLLTAETAALYVDAAKVNSRSLMCHNVCSRTLKLNLNLEMGAT